MTELKCVIGRSSLLSPTPFSSLAMLRDNCAAGGRVRGASGGLKGITGIVLLFTVFSVCLSGQPKAPTFEVASVKRFAGRDNLIYTTRGGPGTADPGRFTDVGDLAGLLSYVYGYQSAASRPSFKIKYPDWARTEYYEIVATVLPGATPAQFNVMIQNLLAERFHLVSHYEVDQRPGYEMEVVRTNPTSI